MPANTACMAQRTDESDSQRARAGVTCDRRDTCGGFFANAHPPCAAVDLPEYAPCGGAGFDGSDGIAVGRCAGLAGAAASAAGSSGDSVHCVKVDSSSAQCLTIPQWRSRGNHTADAVPEILECSSAEDEGQAVGADVNGTASGETGGVSGGEGDEGVCCSHGSMPVRVGDRRSECCPWAVGLEPGGAAAGAGTGCCLALDACGVCGGDATVVDADGALRPRGVVACVHACGSVLRPPVSVSGRPQQQRHALDACCMPVERGAACGHQGGKMCCASCWGEDGRPPICMQA